MGDLVPYADFEEMETQRKQKRLVKRTNRLITCLSPVLSPILEKKRSTSNKRKKKTATKKLSV